MLNVKKGEKKGTKESSSSGSSSASASAPAYTGTSGKVRDSARVQQNKRFTEEQQALIDMAKKDKRTGISKDDMKAYKDLNKELGSKGFNKGQVRGPEEHPGRPFGKEPHGHVGPVDHIPVKQ